MQDPHDSPPASTSSPPRLVAVTGATGFLGSHVVKLLLARGYTVRGTVRSTDPSKTHHLTSLPHASSQLTLHVADLLTSDTACFTSVFQNCTTVFHTASPFFLANGTEESLVRPAVEGTAKICAAVAAAPSVVKFIVTSSTAAIYADMGTRGPDHVYSEDDWSLVEELKARKSWYALGKTLAEQAVYAYDFDTARRTLSSSSPSSFSPVSVVTMNPTWILGPMLNATLNTSSQKIHGYLTGDPSSLIPNAYKTLVDVRDVALAHVLASEVASSAGRYLLIGAGPSEKEIVDTIRRWCDAAATTLAETKRPSAARLPLVVSAERAMIPNLFGPTQPAPYHYTCAKALALGVVFTSRQTMIDATLESLTAFQLV